MLAGTGPRAHPPRISTIEELVAELLRVKDPEGHGAVLQRFSGPARDLEPYCRWHPDHYTRSCILRNAVFELLVVCYEAGQSTSIHDYDSDMAWVHPVRGELVEERFVAGPDGALGPWRETLLRPGMQGTITRDRSIHRYSNPGPERAVTLNLYAPPMSHWRVYDATTGQNQLRPAGPVAL